MTSKKILSSLLAVSMLASMLPTNLTAVAGDPPATVEIKSGTDEAKTGTGSMTITLKIKQDITPTVTLADWQYKGTPSTPEVSGNSGSGAVTYQYKVKGADDSTYSETVPTAQGNYTVKAMIAETADYKAGSATADFEIKPYSTGLTITLSIKAPNVTAPTANTGLKYTGQAQNLITAGSAQHGTIKYAVTADNVTNAPADNSESWKTGVPQETNAGKYKVWYKAFATENNYNNSDADFVEVEIAKATVTIAAKNQSIYVGDAVPTLGNDSYTVTGLKGNDTLTTNPTLGYQKDSSAATPSNTEAGTYDIVASGANAGNNYSISYTKGTLTISNKNTQTITADDVTVTYGDTNKSVTASVSNPTTGGGAITYAVKTGSEEYISVDASTGALTINKVPANGKAYVIVTAAETQTYAQATKEVTVTINKASALIKAPTAKNPTHYSSAVQLINAGTVEEGCEITYSLGTKTAAGDTWETDATKIIANKSGTFYVWYKVTGTANYADVAATHIPVTVSQYTAPSKSSQNWTLTMNDYEFDGTAHEPTINGTTRGTVTYTYYNTDTNEKLSAAPSAIGNYKVEVRANGNSSYYSRTQTATYSITNPIDKNGMANVEVFKDNDVNPEAEGKIFAGWFTDETCTTAYTEKTGKAYAKFIDEKILTVKAQISSGTTANSEKTSIRFITSVDSLKYQNVGFKITCNGKTIDRKMTKVYTAINAGGAKVKPTVFSENSKYMEAYTLKNITKDDYDKAFTVTPYYTTQDGTIVEGATNTFTIANMIK